jgi:hypothetical protein
MYNNAPEPQKEVSAVTAVKEESALVEAPAEDDQTWIDTLTSLTMPDDGSGFSFSMASCATLAQDEDHDLALGMDWGGELKTRRLGMMQLEHAMNGLAVATTEIQSGGAPAGSPGKRRTKAASESNAAHNWGGGSEVGPAKAGEVKQKQWHSGTEGAHVGGDGGHMVMQESSSSGSLSSLGRATPMARVNSAQDLCMSRWREEENMRSAAPSPAPVVEETQPRVAKRATLWDVLFGCCQSRRYHLVASAASSGI